MMLMMMVMMMMMMMVVVPPIHVGVIAMKMSSCISINKVKSPKSRTIMRILAESAFLTVIKIT